MICPTCEAAGQKSVVTEGPSMSTAMHCPPFYDEEGKRHVHNSNTRRTDYSCSRGHRWTESHKGRCWCGWPGEHKSEEPKEKHGT